MKITKKLMITSLVMMLMISILFIPACQKEQPKQKVIKIGAILPLSGNLAFLGKPEQVALQIAVEEVNSPESQKIEIIFGDSKGNPKDGLALANKLINIDNVDAIITSTSGVSMAVAPLAAQKNILNFSGCMAPEVVKQGSTIFRLFVNASEEAKVLGKYILENNYKDVGFLVVNHRGPLSETKSIKQLLKDKGITVSFEETYELTQLEFSSQVSKLKNYEVDAILVIGYGFKYPAIFKAVKEQSIDKPFVGNVSFLMPVAVGEGTEIYNNVTFASLPFTNDDKRFINFNNRYKKISQSNPSSFADAAFFYDMIKIIAESVEKSKTTDGKILAQYILNKAEFSGLSGTIKFDKEGDSLIPIKMAKFEEGKVIFINE